MSRILFIDTTYPKAYDFDTLLSQAMGGTESSILRTAAILAGCGHDVSIIQHSRQDSYTQCQVKFWRRDDGMAQTFDHVIVLRKWPQLKTYQKYFPKACFYLWLHTYKNWEFGLKRLLSLPAPVTLIGNSATHERHLTHCLHGGITGKLMSALGVKQIKTAFAYNPIPRFWTALKTNNKNRHQLMFISAPNKGLPQVLEQFKTIKAQMPEVQLLVANPGYRDDESTELDGVTWLGALPQKALLKKVAESLCVLYPQTSFAETFGLIYAEANAVGTPVLAHDIGSAKEILHPENGLVDADDIGVIIKQLRQWQKQYPAVDYRSEFDEGHIASQWQSIFGIEINRA